MLMERETYELYIRHCFDLTHHKSHQTQTPFSAWIWQTWMHGSVQLQKSDTRSLFR